MDTTVCMVYKDKHVNIKPQQPIKLSNPSFVCLKTSEEEARKQLGRWYDTNEPWVRGHSFTLIKVLISMKTLVGMASCCVAGDAYSEASGQVIRTEFISLSPSL